MSDVPKSPEDWCPPVDPAVPTPATDPRLTRPLSSVVCQTGWRVLFITGLLRDMLIRHFATPLNIEEPDLRHLIWRGDTRTRILIESHLRWTPDKTGLRPALLIKRNAYKNLRLGINDLAGTDAQGRYLFTTFWLGSHTVFCINGSGASVELLATEVQRELTQFSKAITKKLGLMRLQVTEVGEAAILEEDKQNFVVPITIGWAYREEWRLEEEALKTHAISLSTLLSP